MTIRTRIGLMVPSTNSVAEPDFNMLVPSDVTVHTQRMWTTNDLTAENMDSMNADVERAARYLATAKVDLIAYACTTGSFYKGAGYDREMLQLIQQTADVPAVATAAAAAEALQFLGVKTISVASPYVEWQNDRLALYYRAYGFQVLNVEGEPEAAASGAQGICDQSPESALEFALGVCRPEAEALFCACTAWRSLEVVKEMERRSGKPVVTSNQATIWAAFRRLGITTPRPDFGSLIDSLAKTAA